jgi:hypothetical protein
MRKIPDGGRLKCPTLCFRCRPQLASVVDLEPSAEFVLHAHRGRPIVVFRLAGVVANHLGRGHNIFIHPDDELKVPVPAGRMSRLAGDVTIKGHATGADPAVGLRGRSKVAPGCLEPGEQVA